MVFSGVALLDAFALFVTLALMAYAVSRQPRSLYAFLLINLVFLGASGWEFFMLTAPTADLAVLYYRLLLVTVYALPALLLVFVRSLQGKPWLSNKVLLGVLFFVASAFLSFGGFLDAGVTLTKIGFESVPSGFSLAYSLLLLGIVAIELIGLYVYSGRLAAQVRPARLFVLAFLLVLALAVIDYVLLPLLAIPIVRGNGFFSILFSFLTLRLALLKNRA